MPSERKGRRMTENPFLNSSLLNRALRLDYCQRLHTAALQLAIRGRGPKPLPDGLNVDQLVQQAYWQGGGAFVRHPSDVEHMFQGMTLSVVQTIDELYCNRIGRSVSTIWDVLSRMARQAGVAEPEYEAVWSTCAYFMERRDALREVAIERTNATWLVTQLGVPTVIQRGASALPDPTVFCVIDVEQGRVLGFRTAESATCTQAPCLALYDAFVGKRHPSPDAPSGLRWPVPTKLLLPTPLTSSIQPLCDELRINIETVSELPQPLVRIDWVQNLAGSQLNVEKFEMAFDTYLRRFHGSGPRDRYERQRIATAHLLGFGRDPATALPALRHLLPAGTSRTGTDGTVFYDGMHFSNELLRYWPNHPVTLRQSVETDARIWVYANGEILCEALARELRRHNGTYRTNRVGG